MCFRPQFVAVAVETWPESVLVGVVDHRGCLPVGLDEHRFGLSLDRNPDKLRATLKHTSNLVISSPCHLQTP